LGGGGGDEGGKGDEDEGSFHFNIYLLLIIKKSKYFLFELKFTKSYRNHSILRDTDTSLITQKLKGFYIELK